MVAVAREWWGLKQLAPLLWSSKAQVLCVLCPSLPAPPHPAPDAAALPDSTRPGCPEAPWARRAETTMRTDSQSK